MKEPLWITWSWTALFDHVPRFLKTLQWLPTALKDNIETPQCSLKALQGLVFADLSNLISKHFPSSIFLLSLSSLQLGDFTFLNWSSFLASKPLYMLFLLPGTISWFFILTLCLSSDFSSSRKPSLTSQARSARSHPCLCMSLFSPLDCEPQEGRTEDVSVTDRNTEVWFTLRTKVQIIVFLSCLRLPNALKMKSEVWPSMCPQHCPA